MATCYIGTTCIDVDCSTQWFNCSTGNWPICHVATGTTLSYTVPASGVKYSVVTIAESGNIDAGLSVPSGGAPDSSTRVNKLLSGAALSFKSMYFPKYLNGTDSTSQYMSECVVSTPSLKTSIVLAPGQTYSFTPCASFYWHTNVQYRGVMSVLEVPDV